MKRNADFNGADQEGVGLYQLTQKNGERWSAARAYLEPNRHRPNLAVRTRAHATRVVFEGQRAVGIEYRQGGAVHAARARREVILAAGALQSPQLLMLSGVSVTARRCAPSASRPSFICRVSAAICGTTSTSSSPTSRRART